MDGRRSAQAFRRATMTGRTATIRLATVDGELTGDFAPERKLRTLSDGEAKEDLLDYLGALRRRLDPRGDFAFELERLIARLERVHDCGA
jgi:hypothetical protein